MKFRDTDFLVNDFLSIDEMKIVLINASILLVLK